MPDDPTTADVTDAGPTPTSKGLGTAELWYALRRSVRGFWRHRGIDSAGALTFYSALSLFPGSLVLVSVFAIASGGKREAAQRITDILSEFAQPSTVEAVRGTLPELLNLPNPGIALAIGLLVGIWTVSSYATSFGRAMNTVYEVQEGRRFLKFRALMIVLALVLIVGFVIIVTILLGTPTVSAAVGANLEIDDNWFWVWNIGKWPVLLVVMFTMLAIVYYFTPNVKHLRLRWVSWGALFALVGWSLATAAFAGYVILFDTYNRIYGWLGGAAALLIWLYITNLVLVLGAEVDAELVRVRQLTAGVPAESTIQLPVRDTARNLTLARQQDQDEADGRSIRERATRRTS